MSNIVPQAPRGRPTVFNQDRAAALLRAIRGGNYLKVAAAHAGISYDTLNRWIKKSQDPNAPDEFRTFGVELERAKADAEVRAVATIQKAGQEGNWQALAWWLERSRPEQWGRREHNVIEAIGFKNDEETKNVGGVELSASGMHALAKRLAKKREQEEIDIVDAELVDDPEMEEALDDLLDDGEVRQQIDDWESEDDVDL